MAHQKGEVLNGTVQKWGPVQLVSGVSPKNMTVYMLCAVLTMLFSTFIPQAQPYILTEILKIPQSQHGELSGYLGFAATLVGLIMPGIWGTLSDQRGRRLVYAIGYLVSALGIALYPLAGSVMLLYLVRMIFAAGSNSSNTMNTALLGDYVNNKDRGKAFGMNAMMGGVGALLTVFVLLRLPSIFQGTGLSSISAGQVTYWIVAGVAVAGAGLATLGLMGRTLKQSEEKRSITHIARDALRAARQDSVISLAYGVMFVASGALTTIGTFFTLWIVTYATTRAGLTSAEALSRAGMIMGICQIMGLVASPMFGILSDKIHRVRAVTLATGLTAVIFSLTLLITDPLSGWMIAVGLLLGFVQISGIITGGALIAQQSPEDVRGSVMGFYQFCGALGTMLVSVIGGWLFDRWLYQGPFVLVAVLSAVVAVWGILVYQSKVVKDSK